MLFRSGVAFVQQETKGSELTNYACSSGSTLSSNCFSITGTKTGIALGAGVEYAVSDNLSWKAEYLYVGVPYAQARDLTTTGFCSTAGRDYCNYRVSSSMQLFRVGLNYHFYGM